MGMEEKEAIYKLFKIDKELDGYYRKIHRLSNDEECKNMAQQIESKNAELAKLEKKLGDTQKEMRKQEMESESCHQEKIQLNQEIYSGSITDAKEMNDVWAKIERLEKKENESFEAYCNLMEEVESLKHKIGKVKEALSDIQARLEEKQERNNQQIDELEQQVKHKKTERAKLEPYIQPKLMSEYERLRAKFSYDTVVLLDSNTDICACGLNLTTEAHNRLLIEGLRNCHNCGRILVCFD